MILYFTGTGNSRHLALVLAEMLGEKQIINIGKLIKNGEKGIFNSENPYIFVLPTYGWRMPRIVSDFIRDADFFGDSRAYFLLTCGDSSGNAGKYAEILCNEKKLCFMGCRSIKMPENYVAMFSVPDEKTSERIIALGERETRRIGSTIEKGETLSVKKSLAGALESSIINPLFYKLFVKSEGFRITKDCTGCGLCSRVCVLNNIRIAEGKPVWGSNCTHCMACICRCPAEAIEYKNKSKGKRRYYLNEKETLNK